MRSTAQFDRPLRRVVRDILLPRTLEGATLTSNPPRIRGISVETKRPSKPTDMGEFATGCWHYQQAAEFWGAVAFRWTAFPWNNYVKTTIAIVEGISLATQVDTVERDANPNHAGSTFLKASSTLRPGSSRAASR